MRPLAAMLAVALLACCGCADLVMKSRWGAPPPAGFGLGPVGGDEGQGPAIAIDASNDQDYLYLVISSSSQHIKSQLLGAFLQDFYIWFDPTDKERPQNGLRIALHRQPGVGFPRYDAEQKAYLKAATREVALHTGGWGGEGRILKDDGREIGLDIAMENGRLSYRLKLPLKAASAGAWEVGAAPGQPLGVMLECSAIDMQIAQLELIREYQESYLGWGWGNGPNPYGPKLGYGAQRNPSLGDYDAAGLDKGIYATHGVYRPLSWESVPRRLDARISLRLASGP